MARRMSGTGKGIEGHGEEEMARRMSGTGKETEGHEEEEMARGMSGTGKETEGHGEEEMARRMSGTGKETEGHGEEQMVTVFSYNNILEFVLSCPRIRGGGRLLCLSMATALTIISLFALT